MADPRFFKSRGPLTLAELAELTGAELAGARDPGAQIVDVAPLDAAGPDHVSFLDNRKYVDRFAESRAGACLVSPDHAAQAPEGMALLLTDQPYRAYAMVARAFYPEEALEPGVDPHAVVDESARLGTDSRIEAGAVVGAGAEIGARVRIGANTVVGPGVVIGDDTIIGTNASLQRCLIGRECQIHAGARIGERGFGFAMDDEGFIEVPQLGRVVVEDHVEIGANVTIDRGSGPDTVVGAGSRIDNLVQLGHNVRLGRGCVVVAQAGVAGSTVLEDGVIIAAQGGLVGHLTIGKGARIGAQAGVMRDVPAGESVIGAPAIPVKEFFRQQATLSRLARQRKKEE